MSDAPWKQFQDAVADFIGALAPYAAVRRGEKLPDVDTGRTRERDVWIEAKFADHFKITFLVSCKRYQRKLDQQHIDAFIGELRSSGANKGIMYSYSGYTAPAIEKARKLGISCCCLYADRPPEIPEVLLFRSYCCAPQIGITLVPTAELKKECSTFRDIFDLHLPGPKEPHTVIDAIVAFYRQEEAKALEAFKANPRETMFPQDWASWLVCRGIHDQSELFRILVRGPWQVYRGKVEAHLLNGSYEFTSGDFKGSQSTPCVDMRGPHPGPGWELLPQRPSHVEHNVLIFVLLHGDARSTLVEHYGERALA